MSVAWLPYGMSAYTLGYPRPRSVQTGKKFADMTVKYSRLLSVGPVTRLLDDFERAISHALLEERVIA